MPETRSERIRLPVEIDDRIDSHLVTAHAGGVPLVIELFRRVGATQVVNDQVRIKQRQRRVASGAVSGNVDRLVDCGWGPLPRRAGPAHRCRASRLAGPCATCRHDDARLLGGVSCRGFSVVARLREDRRP